MQRAFVLRVFDLRTASRVLTKILEDRPFFTFALQGLTLEWTDNVPGPEHRIGLRDHSRGVATTITFPLNILSRANIGTPAADLLLLVTLEAERPDGLHPYLPTGVIDKGVHRATVMYELIPDSLGRRPDFQPLKRRRSTSPEEGPKRQKIWDVDAEMMDLSPSCHEASIDVNSLLD
jgi:hypothetical protein